MSITAASRPTRQASLARLHDRADTVPDELLPCRVSDSDLWFAMAPAQVESAKTLCRECPVRERCLAGALERGEPWGVWGGELLLHGVVIPRKRPRGRPRKGRPGAPALVASAPDPTTRTP